ncbi:T cell receptor delta constant isoform X1 [Ornithorhynchus anatinus]|uniref:T cell receptor delta constant isoform X1 n=1 Tax=Ornithorhynchus anatinus TaxID=9258 RepID=UPI0010A7BE1A|nr:T cell receptor delta constant isoform X1 [Ornithorhynchus anatinus]
MHSDLRNPHRSHGTGKPPTPRENSLAECASQEKGFSIEGCGGALSAQLIFGAGTKLTVEPRGNQDYREPSVFLLKNESTYACVANNFYPKNAKIHMKLPGKKTITNIEHKAVTSDGKYSMVQITEFESDGAVNCTVEHEGKYVTPQQDKEKTDDSKTKTDKESTSKNSMSDSGKDDAQSNQQEAGPICREIKVRSEVVNTLSVTVLGLRVIFAKSVTLNLLLTAKYFFF